VALEEPLDLVQHLAGPVEGQRPQQRGRVVHGRRAAQVDGGQLVATQHPAPGRRRRDLVEGGQVEQEAAQQRVADRQVRLPAVGQVLGAHAAPPSSSR
jgi:hypothetical protein